MFSGYEFYCYDDLFLDEQMLKTLKIDKVTGIQLIALFQKYNNVLRNDIDFNSNYFCTLRNGSLVVLPIQVYYSINNGDEVLCLYDNKSIRDAKLKYINQFGMHSIVQDMTSNSELINEFKKQKKLKDVYNKLKA